MKEYIIQKTLSRLKIMLNDHQVNAVREILIEELINYNIVYSTNSPEEYRHKNEELLTLFISSKKIEGCSKQTLKYYTSSIEQLFNTVNKKIIHISTNDIRQFLSNYQTKRNLSKVTIDNLRRIYSSFFAWLEDEDYIAKSPVRRIHKVRTDSLVKEIINDESIEKLRDSCTEIRDLAMIDLFISTGIRVGELVKINRDDIDFQERECVVFGKGNKEREVYFNARTKIHLQKYLKERKDSNPALFVSLKSPNNRLSISGIELRLRQLGEKVGLTKIHPHKFRRTLATMAIDKGMPIE